MHWLLLVRKAFCSLSPRERAGVRVRDGADNQAAIAQPKPRGGAAVARVVDRRGKKLWQRLRAGQVAGLKFRRQHPFPPYVVDSYCDAMKLVVELDGSQHTEAGDRVRTRVLESQGLMVLRFWSNEALTQTDAVVEAIFNAAGNRNLTPTPLPEGEGL